MDAALAGFIEAKQVEDKATDDSEIGASIFLSGAHLVVVQCNIQTPMDAIFYSPMSPHHISQRAGVGSNAADVEAALAARLTIDRAFRLDHPEHLQIGPLMGSRQALQLGERPAAPDLQPAVILLHRLGIGVRSLLSKITETPWMML